MTNVKLAELFVELADIMEIGGDDPFKILSYRRAAEQIRQQKKQIKSMSDEDVHKISGVGKAISDKIKNALKDGSFGALESKRNSKHGELYKVSKAIGVTPIRFRNLIAKVNAKSVEELRFALKSIPDNSYNKIDTDMLNKIALHIGAKK